MGSISLLVLSTLPIATCPINDSGVSVVTPQLLLTVPKKPESLSPTLGIFKFSFAITVAAVAS